MKRQMKKRTWALAAALALGGFATASGSMTASPETQSQLAFWATVVFCDQDGDGQVEQHEVCVGGHTGGIAGQLVEGVLSVVPGGSPASTFLSQ